MTQRHMVTNITASQINLNPTTDDWATEASCCLTNVNNYVSVSAFIQKEYLSVSGKVEYGHWLDIRCFTT